MTSFILLESLFLWSGDHRVNTKDLSLTPHVKSSVLSIYNLRPCCPMCLHCGVSELGAPPASGGWRAGQPARRAAELPSWRSAVRLRLRGLQNPADFLSKTLQTAAHFCRTLLQAAPCRDCVTYSCLYCAVSISIPNLISHSTNSKDHVDMLYESNM